MTSNAASLPAPVVPAVTITALHLLQCIDEADKQTQHLQRAAVGFAATIDPET
jgi:hypothetical protein